MKTGALIYFPGYFWPYKFIQIADLIGGLPGFLDKANSTLSHVSLKSEIQSIKEKIYSTEMFFSAFDQKGKVLQSMERLRKKHLMAEK